MKFKKYIAVLAASSILAMNMTGCRPYDKPELYTIEASQTAFLIDLVGNGEQASFESEEALANAKVATKEVQIPHRWIKTGRGILGFEPGEWRPTQKLIIVERKPVTREWSADATNGTSSADQAIYAESKESIGFSTGMNITSQIYSEDDAVKFLYEYNNVTLEIVMDSEIRSYVETVWNELTSSLTMQQIIEGKADLMSQLRDTVIPYFKNKGITITTLGMKDGITYEDPQIQKAINDQIISGQNLVTEQNNTKIKQEQADSDYYVTVKAAEAQAEANTKLSESLTPELMELQKIQALADTWNGELPTVMGSEGSILGLDFSTGEIK